jgi:hypothetical protein
MENTIENIYEIRVREPELVMEISTDLNPHMYKNQITIKKDNAKYAKVGSLSEP